MWVKKFKKHKQIKNKLLKLIEEIPKSQVYQSEQNKISHTDFYLPSNTPRKYLEYFYKNIGSHMSELCDTFYSKEWNIYSSWFQQYYQGDVHGWHNHGESQFAGVYYLEMPETHMVTDFLDGSEIEASEGDILIFPSYKYHRSKENTSKKRKTVIAFNLSFDIWNGQIP